MSGCAHMNPKETCASCDPRYARPKEPTSEELTSEELVAHAREVLCGCSDVRCSLGYLLAARLESAREAMQVAVHAAIRVKGSSYYNIDEGAILDLRQELSR